ncbi:MAG: DUF1007 family protein [Pseudomonadales bacterium]|uniref:ABC transporter subunit protein n=1 Tax=Oleiphilus messinensis TaxID=141451 RepID=A0A1Y0ICW1_9GAMM|nr:DUF1007 family protein [Oleiphilus messinensis]ARU58090.1 ABC transporter subunit protein [Oleiphilus messinensis]MCG8610340.1 DUF1007 family protein [Pseudomonadales bacterium]
MTINRYIRLRVVQALCVFLAIFGLIAGVQAHPHSWIELNTRFVLDKQAHLVQIRQRWEFDVYYSMMTLADSRNEYGNDTTGLPQMATKMIRNLKAYGYFSKLSVDGANIALAMPDPYRLSTKAKNGHEVLELEMIFDIQQGMNIENKTLHWQVFDPTYYIAMIHVDENSIEIIGGDATECSRKIEFPDPSDDLIEYAQSLDRTQKNTEGLGAAFADMIVVNCY